MFSMEDTSENREKKHIAIGILAHVDAGKTTLSEGLLYTGGMIRKPGRVDKQDAFLDTDVMEKERGITIFSKQAVLKLPEHVITLLDTPGHVDFSAETERTLGVLDYAILVISGADGIQGHTKTLWRLLEEYEIPVFLFINKMDQPGADKNLLLAELKRRLSDNCISFEDTESKEFLEEAAMCSEEALECFLETGKLGREMISGMIADRRVFPCYFGSALKMTGVEEFLQGICRFTLQKEYPEAFGARVFKIARDADNNRLTYMKITGGALEVRTSLQNAERTWEEKVNQIRIYSGAKYETEQKACAGEICAVTGLTKTYAGEGLGTEAFFKEPLLEPVLTYRVLLPKEWNALQILPKLRQLEEEDPMLHLLWNETHQEILVQVMGEVQTEILKRQVWDRFGVEIGFDAGHILYKETIADTVEGVGHFEPLRHYAEVHLLLEPGARGSGLVFWSDCSEDVLDRNWQRLILTHLKEKEHAGVLTGSAITDMKIILASGKAHQKHTEGGDFRQAVYRAVRQGLKQAQSVLLEPYYEYRLEAPERFIGRAMTDLKMRQAAEKEAEISLEQPNAAHAAGVVLEGIEDGMAVLTGRAPVSVLQEYAKEVAAYTKGEGRLSFSYGGYDICHNSAEVIARIGYDSETDPANPTGSVFCAHGAGFYVEWSLVPEYMHLESILLKRRKEKEEAALRVQSGDKEEGWLAAEEVDAILAKTYGANKRDKSVPRKGYKTSRHIISAKTEPTEHTKPLKEDLREAYLLVDGYNIIYGWEELRELAKENMDGARGRLLDMLCNYQGMKQCQVIVVFDAYRVEGHRTEFFDYHNIHVVYTKEAETADAYIERFSHENGKKYRITVATSDGLEQIIIRGAGCLLLSAKDLSEEISRLNDEALREHLPPLKGSRNYLLDHVSEEAADQIKRAVAENAQK